MRRRGDGGALAHARFREPDYAGTYEHLYLDIYPDRLKSFPSPHIASSLPVRPHTPSPRAEDPDARPLVYVTFGTHFNHDLTTIGTVVEGVRELDVDVLVTLGPGTNPTGLGAQPDDVDVRDYVPQEETLARAAAVVSHAGSGTFLAALAHGLPQLALPPPADQFLNAHAAANAGVGAGDRTRRDNGAARASGARARTRRGQRICPMHGCGGAERPRRARASPPSIRQRDTTMAA